MEHSQQVIDKFNSLVDRKGPDDCWEWKGGKRGDGYGYFCVYAKMIGAHRFSLELKLGHEIPKGMNALHSCDNPPCVNPAHLRVGTDRDNIIDAMERGRWKKPPKIVAKGEKNNACKISEEQAKEILRLRMTRMAMRDIAERLGFRYHIVTNIIVGKAWSYLLGTDGLPTKEQLKSLGKIYRKRGQIRPPGDIT